MDSNRLQDLLRRVEELESQAAFRDELQSRLNDVVARQDREIIRLKDQLAALARRLRDLGEALPDDSTGSGEEIPPHY